MIYTVTFNPSLDYIIDVDDFQTGKVNRTHKEIIYPGGKGINVSIVLHNLGYENVALGFIGGFTGNEILRLLHDKGVKTDFITCKTGASRINVKMRSQCETEINGMGPMIQEEEIKELYTKLKKLNEDDILILSGSIPSMMPKTIYMDILKYLDGTGVRVVLDCTKELLAKALPYHPFLIKPNNFELEDLFGVKIETKNDVCEYAKKLQDMGARNVLVSMSKDGALLLDENGVEYRMDAPNGHLVNSVGAGDSMVAGFVAGYLATKDYEEALKIGVCTGSASAFSDELATKEEVKELLKLGK